MSYRCTLNANLNGFSCGIAAEGCSGAPSIPGPSSNISWSATKVACCRLRVSLRIWYQVWHACYEQAWVMQALLYMSFNSAFTGDVDNLLPAFAADGRPGGELYEGGGRGMRRSMRRFSMQAQALLPCGRCSAFVGQGVVSGSATD